MARRCCSSEELSCIAIIQICYKKNSRPLAYSSVLQMFTSGAVKLNTPF